MKDTSRMLARIADATRVYHATADADRLAPLAAPTSLAGYRTYLARIYGFDVPIERACAAIPGLARRIELPGSDRAQLISHDLLEVGYTLPQIEQLPRCSEIPVLTELVEALGWLYVIGRNALLNGIIRRHLSRRLATQAWAYLASFETASAVHWRALGLLLDEACCSLADAQRAIDAAIRAFKVQHCWLRGLPVYGVAHFQ